jgi:hypothetical protein
MGKRVKAGGDSFAGASYGVREMDKVCRRDDDGTEEGGSRNEMEGVTEVEDEGKEDISLPFFTPIHLQVGPFGILYYIL